MLVLISTFSCVAVEVYIIHASDKIVWVHWQVFDAYENNLQDAILQDE